MQHHTYDMYQIKVRLAESGLEPDSAARLNSSLRLYQQLLSGGRQCLPRCPTGVPQTR